MKIWSAWLQGYDNAPKMVRQIFEIWDHFNPEADFKILDQSDADKILSEMRIKKQKMSPQVQTDLVRTHLISRYGGYWVDSTLLPTKPLKKWFIDELSDLDFFAFASGGDKNLVLQNWFLYSKKNNYLSLEWEKIFSDYFYSNRYFPNMKRALFHIKLFDYLKYNQKIKKGDTLWFVDPERGRNNPFYPYAVHNYNFSYLLRNDPKAKLIWDKVPYKSAAVPSLLGGLSMDKETDENNFLLMANEILPISPVHKLKRNSLCSIAVDQFYNKIF